MKWKHFQHQTVLCSVVMGMIPTVLAKEAQPLETNVLMSLNQPLAQLALRFNPPNRGAPGKTRDAGTRPLCIKPKQFLTALGPRENWGETVDAYPAWLVYIPYTDGTVNLLLRDERTQENVYRTSFQAKNGPGIHQFQLPEAAPSLEVDRLYRWQIDFVCNPKTQTVFRVDGIIVRRSLSQQLKSELQNASSRERIDLLANQGFWYSAIKELANLRHSQPQDPELKADWENLLKHPMVGLDDMVAEPLIN